ncbi:hypothetical protein ABDK00_016860 [Niabella insulamsoli]|uniref:hypothetical protein n=1 Tax=Niabella insulamsoli TaxID=3144874 RepID=UPI0031FC4C4E
MRSIKAANKQEVIDLAMQGSGSIDAVLDMCLKNDTSLTEDVTNGQSFLTADMRNKFVTQHFETERVKPSSAPGDLPDGIGFWIIGLDFKVS